MSARRFVRTRTPGWCDSDFAHPGRIGYGDIVGVHTVYPRDEYARDFGVKPFTRWRRCQWCVLAEQAQFARRGYTTLALRDRHGDVWRVGGDGLLHTRETAPFSFEHVQRKWGPLRVAHEPAEQ